MSKRSKKSKRRPHYNKKHKFNRQTPKMQPELARPPSLDYVLINQEELDLLSKYILDYPDLETGGQLFGFWRFDGRPVIHLVLGPGPMAEHQRTFFMQDLAYLKDQANLLKQKYGLEHIGEWHSHHKLGLAYPSQHDAQNISSNMRKLGYAKFLLCIGTCQNDSSSIQAFMFTKEKDDYIKVPWLIHKQDFSYRSRLEDHDSRALLYPKTKSPKMESLYLKEALSETPSKLPLDHSYWLSNQSNRKILKQILDQLNSSPFENCRATLDAQNEVHLTLYQGQTEREDIHFPKFFPQEPPIIRNAQGDVLNLAIPWTYTNDIFNSFLTFYNTFKSKTYDKR
ncbi:MAG: Mov34/MPN/PAD-1 family protein [Desulfovibrionaceae bacterium]|nr:Mov34/MPN/PAD-1 family protein [Desulfovibrionaceae bacterium]